MRKPVITFDCDGVLANFTKKFTDLVNSLFGMSYTPDWPDYDALTFMTREHWERGLALVQADPYFWSFLEPYSDTPFKKIGAMLFEGAFTGYVVSRRSSSTDADPAAHTRYWLHEQGLTHLQGVIVGMQDRAVLLSLLECDAHLDDYGQQVLDLRARGVNAYLLDRPWNQDTLINPEFRVFSVDEFLERVVAPFLPAEVAKTYFSPPQITDLVPFSNFVPASAVAQLIRDTGFKFSELVDPSLVSTN
jgi:hypothetical protein